MSTSELLGVDGAILTGLDGAILLGYAYTNYPQGWLLQSAFPNVLAQLNDLPSTFKRVGPPYTNLMDSLASELALFVGGAASEVTQLTFASALDGWLDVWGLIFDVLRQTNESNTAYQARISETVLAWVGTVPALQAWLALFTPGGSLIETGGGQLGYAINLPASMTTSQVTAFLATLSRIRPAGVPFTVNTVSAGLYLGTVEFLGNNGLMAGAYLSSYGTSFALTFAANTNNATPQLPDLYFVDPTLNPA
jgi:hypothetical protein